jgi:hypothetical protein
MRYQCECDFANKPCIIESDINLELAPSGNPPFVCAFRFWGESLWVPLQTLPTAALVEAQKTPTNTGSPKLLDDLTLAIGYLNRKYVASAIYVLEQAIKQLRASA